MKRPDMERREFLKKAALSATALAASQGLGLSLPAPVLADERGRIGFILVCISVRRNAGPGALDRFAMTGTGTFGKDGVEGGGSYVHFDFPGSPPPFPMLETGTWRAERFVGWRKAEGDPNPYGQYLSGILDLRVRLFPEGGPRRGVRARMAVI